jgi:hypothetical protein
MRLALIAAQVPTISVGIPKPIPQPSAILSLVLYDCAAEDEVVEVGVEVCPAGRVIFVLLVDVAKRVVDVAKVVVVIASAAVLEGVCKSVFVRRILVEK